MQNSAYLVAFIIGLTVFASVAALPKVIAVTSIPSNETSSPGNTPKDGKNMMMPGGNMTFGSSLENAKMHLMEALMDLKNGDSKGAAMQLNMTDQAIKLHERELESMMLIMKRGNVTSSSDIAKSENTSTMMN